MGAAQCCGYFGGTLLILGSSVVLIVLVLAYLPNLAALFYHEGLCVVTKAIYTIQYACDCGDACKALYPCVLIYATINSSNVAEVDRRWPIVLFDDDWQQIKVYLDGESDPAERCSVRTCAPTSQANRDYIELYKAHFETGSAHKCYFNPYYIHQRGAVLNRRISWTLAFHVIFWPGICLLVGVLLCFYVLYTRKSKGKRYNMEDRRRRENFSVERY